MTVNWVRRGLIWVGQGRSPIPDPAPRLGRPVLPLEFTPFERLEAVRRYREGDRSPQTIDARREYFRVTKRRSQKRGVDKVGGPYPMSDGRETMVEEHRRKSAPRGVAAPLRGASPTERNTDRRG